MKPDIENTLSGYRFSWRDAGLIIDVSRVNIHTEGRITGELLLTTIDHQPIYPQTNFNFTSEQSRTRLAKTLTEKDSTREWPDIINQLSLIVIERARQGEPTQELWTYDDIPAPEYLLKPFLMKGLPTVLFGEKGATKSNTALLIYICLILPWMDNPFGWKPAERSIKTLYCDYELPGGITQYNAKMIQEGMGLPPFPLYHRRCSAPLVDDLERIMNHIMKLGAEVIIIDSLARACGGDLIKTEPANAFFEALDRLHVTSLILAQTSKDIETKRKSIYGNALFTYYARSIFEICKSDISADNVVDVGIFHRWSNLSQLYPDIGLRFSFNGHGTRIEPQPVSVAEFRAKVNSQKAIMDTLKTGPMAVKELADITGASENSARVILSKLKKRGLVINPEKGKWGLCFKDS